MKVMYVLLLCFGVPIVLGHKYGAPATACTTLKPVHTDISPQTSASPYSLEIVGGATSFTEGTSIKVKITGPHYGGFLLQLRKKGEMTPLGTWTALPTGTQLLTCTTAGSSITHTSPDMKDTTLEFTWNPPASAKGEYEFVATVAEGRSTYWIGLKSSTLTANYPPGGTGGKASMGVSFACLILAILMLMACV